MVGGESDGEVALLVGFGSGLAMEAGSGSKVVRTSLAGTMGKETVEKT